MKRFNKEVREDTHKVRQGRRRVVRRGTGLSISPASGLPLTVDLVSF